MISAKTIFNYELNVHWHEHDNNILPYLQKSDVVVLPSYYPEGIPRSLLEAMACENAIITTNTPGCRDVVDFSNGRLVEPKNHIALADYLMEFVQMPDEELEYMKLNSRELVTKKFSDNVIIQAHLKLYSAPSSSL